jgi:hypothetical protein
MYLVREIKKKHTMLRRKTNFQSSYANEGNWLTTSLTSREFYLKAVDI